MGTPYLITKAHSYFCDLKPIFHFALTRGACPLVAENELPNPLRPPTAAMAEAMSQDSDAGETAAQLDAKYGDLEDAAKTPPKDDDDTPPAWLDEAAAMLKSAGPSANNPPAAAPGAVAAALLPIRSESSQLVEQMSGAAVSAASAASSGNGPAGPSKTAAAGGKPGGKPDDSSTDDSDDDELTPEEKEKAELVENINKVVACAKAQGYTFSGRSETTAVATFLDEKALFDDEGLDITICATEKKKISLNAVNKKIAELRAAEVEKRKTGQLVVGGESQFDFGSEGEEDEPKPEDEPEVPHPPSPSPTPILLSRYS